MKTPVALTFACFLFACGDDGSVPSGGAGPQGGASTQAGGAASGGSSSGGEGVGAGPIGGGGAGVGASAEGGRGNEGGTGGAPETCELTWAQSYSVDAATIFSDVAVVSTGDIVAAGAASADPDLYFGMGDIRPFVTRFSATGSPSWSVELPMDGKVYPPRVVVGNDDTIYVAGSFEGALTIGGDVVASVFWRDIFLVALDPDGNLLWHEEIGGAGTQEIVDMAVAPNGDIVIGARISDSIDFGGGVLTSTSGDDIAIGRLDPDGAHVASLRLGDTLYDSLYSMAVTSDDRILVGAERSENFDSSNYIAAWDANLENEIWHDDLPTIHPYVAAHPNGEISIIGDGGWASRFDHEGAELSMSVIDSGVFGFSGTNVASSTDNRTWMLGTAEQTVDLGTGPVTADGGDAIIAFYDANWTPVFAKLYGGSGWANTSAMAPTGASEAIVVGLYYDELAVCPAPLVASGTGASAFIAKVSL